MEKPGNCQAFITNRSLTGLFLWLLGLALLTTRCLLFATLLGLLRLVGALVDLRTTLFLLLLLLLGLTLRIVLL